MTERGRVSFSVVEARGVPVNGVLFEPAIIQSSPFILVQGVNPEACMQCPLQKGNIYAPGSKKAQIICSQERQLQQSAHWQQFMSADEQPPGYEIAVKLNVIHHLRHLAATRFAEVATCADLSTSNIAEIIDHFRPR